MTKFFAGPGVLGFASVSLSAVLAVAPAFAAWAADDPPADASATVSADTKAVGAAVKRDARAVAKAAKDAAHQVAGAAKEVAHEVAAASKEGAKKVAAASRESAKNVSDAAKHGAEKTKAVLAGYCSMIALAATEFFHGRRGNE